MDPAQSLYDSPSSMMDYSHEDEHWQPNDGMELELVGKSDSEKPTGVGHVKVKNKPTTIASRYQTLSRSGVETKTTSVSFQPHIWKYQIALVILSLSVSVVAAILASVALKNSRPKSSGWRKSASSELDREAEPAPRCKFFW